MLTRTYLLSDRDARSKVGTRSTKFEKQLYPTCLIGFLFSKVLKSNANDGLIAKTSYFVFNALFYALFSAAAFEEVSTTYLISRMRKSNLQS